MTMKAIRFHDFGEPHVLQLEDVPMPVLQDGDVLVRVHAAGVNPIDSKVRQGMLHAMIKHSLPLTPGWDFSGVTETSAGGIDAGTAVFGKADVSRDGAYAQYIAVNAAALAPKPTTVDHISAAEIRRASCRERV